MDELECEAKRTTDENYTPEGAFEDFDSYYQHFVLLADEEQEAAEEAAKKLTQEVEVRWQPRGKKVSASFCICMSEDWTPLVDDYIVIILRDGKSLKTKVHSSDSYDGSVTVTFRSFEGITPNASPPPWTDPTGEASLLHVKPGVDLHLFRRWREALSTFVRMNAPPTSIASVILGKEKSQRCFDAAEPKTKLLTQSQSLCVSEALSRNLTIIQGPPGTGKSTIAVHLVLAYRAEMARKKQKQFPILVTASSNAAADHLATNLHEAGLKVLRPRARRAEPPSDYLRSITFESMADHFYETSGTSARVKMLQDKLLADALTREESSELFGAVLEAQGKACRDADVVCTTNAISGSFKRMNLAFSYVIVDEAAQATELDVLMPFTASTMCSQLVLIGDHQQLRPIIRSNRANALKLGVSMFERLLSLDNEAFMLTTQFRMHPAICDFPSQLFYNSRLKTHKTVLSRKPSPLPWLVDNVPVIIMHCTGEEERAGVSTRNIHEAREVLSLLQRLKLANIPKESVTVITPYAAQRNYIQERIAQQMLTQDIRVASVDSMQGSESDYIIVSTVRSNDRNEVGFLSDRRRFNVTLTRARLGVFVVCNVRTISSTWTWHAFLTYFENSIMNSMDEDEIDDY